MEPIKDIELNNSVSEIYPAFVTWKTQKPSKIIFTREESMTASTPRHEMERQRRFVCQ